GEGCRRPRRRRTSEGPPSPVRAGPDTTRAAARSFSLLVPPQLTGRRPRHAPRARARPVGSAPCRLPLEGTPVQSSLLEFAVATPLALLAAIIMIPACTNLWWMLHAWRTPEVHESTA